MKHYPNSVTNRQIFFILFLTMTTYTTIDLPSLMAETSGRISWLPIILMSIVYAVVAFMICRLNTINQGKVLFDYGKDIVGKLFNYIICIYYLIYFLIIGTYLKSKLVGLMTSNFLPLTPPFAILLIGIPIFSYIAYKGITNIARITEIIGIFFIIITVVLCIFMISQGQLNNIRPFLNPLDIQSIAPSMKNLLVAYGGIELLFIIPFTAINKKACRKVFKTLIFIGLFYVLIVESTIMIIGINNTMMLHDSFIEAIKIVRLPIIERTDVFYLTFGLTSLFSGLFIVNLAIVEYACKFFKRVKREIIVTIIGTMLFVLVLVVLNIPNFEEIAANTLPIIVGVGALLIPIILYVVAMIKRLIAKKRTISEEKE